MGIAFLQAATASASDLTAYTFSAQSLGAAAADRVIIVVFHAEASTDTLDLQLSTITVGGISGAVQVQTAQVSSGTSIVGIATAPVPTGTTGDVVITMSDACVRMQVALYRADALFSEIPRFTEGHLSEPSEGLAISIPKGGFVVAGLVSNLAGSVTWGGLDEDYDGTVETMTYSGASREFTEKQEGYEITSVPTVGSVSRTCIASWAPSSYVEPSKGKEFYVFDGFTLTGWTGDARMQPIEQVNRVNIIGTGDVDPVSWDADELPRAVGALMHGRLWFSDIEAWDASSDAVRSANYQAVLGRIKAGMGTDVGWGEYTVIPKRDYFRSIGGRESADYLAWQAENDFYKDIHRNYVFVFPSVYTFFKEEERWRTYARENIREARRLAPNRKIIAFITPLFHNSSFPTQRPPGSYWRSMMQLCYEEADGIVFWSSDSTSFDSTEGWWIEQDAFLDELTNIKTFPLPPKTPAVSWNHPTTNVVPHGDWLERTSSLPPYWTDTSASVTWADKASFEDFDAYSIITVSNAEALGRPTARVSVFPAEIGQDFTLYAYIHSYQHDGGSNNGGVRTISPNRGIVGASTNFTGPGYYAVGVTTTTTGPLIQIGLGFSNNQQATIRFSQIGMAHGFIGPVTGDNDQRGPLTAEQLFGVRTVLNAPPGLRSPTPLQRAVAAPQASTLGGLQKIHAKVQADLVNNSRRRRR